MSSGRTTRGQTALRTGRWSSRTIHANTALHAVASGHRARNKGRHDGAHSRLAQDRNRGGGLNTSETQRRTHDGVPVRTRELQVQPQQTREAAAIAEPTRKTSAARELDPQTAATPAKSPSHRAIKDTLSATRQRCVHELRTPAPMCAREALSHPLPHRARHEAPVNTSALNTSAMSSHRRIVLTCINSWASAGGGSTTSRAHEEMLVACGRSQGRYFETFHETWCARLGLGRAAVLQTSMLARERIVEL